METPPEICPNCGGTGFVLRDVGLQHPDFGKPFPCPACDTYEKRRAGNLWKLSGLQNYQDKTFEGFQTHIEHYSAENNRRLQVAYNQARIYAENLSGWFVLYGNSGVGKTHLALAIANEALRRGLRLIFITVPDLLDYLRAAYSPQSGDNYDQRFETLCRVPLLVLDDLGAESPTAWAQEKLFQLINRRYHGRLATVFTTNLPLDSLNERLASRLQDRQLSLLMNLELPDYRRDSMQNDSYIQTLKELSQRTYLSHKTFANFDPARLSAEEQTFLSHYTQKPSGWVLIMGGHGSGKTHLCAALTNGYMQAHPEQEPILANTLDVLDFLRSGFGERAKTNFDERFQALRGCPFLVLDNFRLTARTSEWAQDKLFQLLDFRYITQLPTVFGVAYTDLKAIQADFPSIYSRLFDADLSYFINLREEDYRLNRRKAGGVSRQS
jgi:DNA replication protein DnaC